MARLEFHCAFCGMPAITLLKGTAVCNNERCQVSAGLTASPTGPGGIQTPHGPGVPRRVPGPNETPTNVRKVSRGTLIKNAAGLEVQSIDDTGNKLHLAHPDELIDVIMFIREHFHEEWNEMLRTLPDLRELEGHGRYTEKINLATRAKEARVELEDEQ